MFGSGYAAMVIARLQQNFGVRSQQFRESVTIREFWHSTFTAPRVAIVCAAIASALNLGSYTGLGMTWANGVFGVVHLAIMALGFLLFARLALHHRLSWRAGGWRPEVTPLPRRLVWGTVASFAYMLALFLGLFAVYGEGNAEIRNGREVWVVADSVVRALAPGSVATFDARMLRAFSAVWLFFGLLIALTGHRVEERIREYRSTARQAAT
jgi:hypothetical protein